MPTWKELADLPLEQRTKLKWNDPRILDYVRAVEAQFTLPANALRTLLYSENSFIDKSGKVQLNTTNDSTTVSKAKARGIMQFTDATMKLMEDRWKHNATDPLENVWFAADYLNHTLHKQYKGNIVAAIADYNGGWKQAKNVLKNTMPTSKQTTDYLKKAAHHSSVFDSEEQEASTQPKTKDSWGVNPKKEEKNNQNLINPDDVFSFFKRNNIEPRSTAFKARGDGVVGRFNRDTYTIDADVSRGNGSVTTLMHEATHAFQTVADVASSVIDDKLAAGKKLSGEEKRFTEALQSINGVYEGRVGNADLSRILSAKEALERKARVMNVPNNGEKDDYFEYRTRRRESQAFGVGHSTQGGISESYLNPHKNATEATEIMVLMDLYDRLPDDIKQAVSKDITLRKETPVENSTSDMHIHKEALSNDAPSGFAETPAGAATGVQK